MGSEMSRRGFLAGVAGAAAAGALRTRSAEAQARTLTIWHTEVSDVSVRRCRSREDPPRAPAGTRDF